MVDGNSQYLEPKHDKTTKILKFVPRKDKEASNDTNTEATKGKGDAASVASDASSIQTSRKSPKKRGRAVLLYLQSPHLLPPTI